jgi:isopropylmalate/homocitrate/citramalate synthase
MTDERNILQAPYGGDQAMLEDLWVEYDMTERGDAEAHPALAAGYEALDSLSNGAETDIPTVHFTDVTLRDGQQQRTNEVTMEQRIGVFDQIVSTGIDRIETGHLGNQEDREFAAALIERIAQREETDERYARVKIQVLFGSQEHLIEQGSDALCEAFQQHYGKDWEKAMADKVVVHVYDRIDQNLINTASSPYSPMESATRIYHASQHAINKGFRHFSISAEAATAVKPEDAIQFYGYINHLLLANGAASVNNNLANTYGYSPNEAWNAASMTIFNQAVKHGFDGRVTTSVHAHNDTEASTDFAMSAAVAGFDRIEGTLIGMGERSGNTALVTFVARVLEQARHQNIAEQQPGSRRSRIAQAAAAVGLRRVVRMPEQVIANLANLYPAGSSIANTFGPDAFYRWHRTSLGSPYIHDNGSGPHDAALAAAASRPVECPPYNNYEWGLLLSAAMGRPGAEDIAVGDPEAIDKVTVGNHMGGGKTRAIREGRLSRASAAEIAQARADFREEICAIGRIARTGVAVRAA